MINYIDRQSLSVVAPFLKSDFHWSNQQFAWIIISFRLAYALGQALTGRLLDRVGTRNGLTLSVAWYSVAAMLTPLATGLKSLCAFRFLLGAGESGNWPGATKAVSEWFPREERGLAVAFFDSGSAVGAAVAPILVLTLYNVFGSWRPALAIPGLLGIVWLIVWRRVYYVPATPPDLDEDRLQMERTRWRDLLRLPETWGIILGRALTDPVWFFVTDWFAIYLVAKGIRLEEGVLAFWIPFVAADAGNFLAGGISGWLIRRGWSPVRSRKAIILVCGAGMALLAPSVVTSNLYALAALFSISTCAYAAWSTMGLTLPSDLYPQHAVGSVSGLGGAGAGFGTIASTYLIGWTTDHYSFEPVLIAASLIPLLATAMVFLLVHEPKRMKAEAPGVQI